MGGKIKIYKSPYEFVKGEVYKEKIVLKNNPSLPERKTLSFFELLEEQKEKEGDDKNEKRI